MMKIEVSSAGCRLEGTGSGEDMLCDIACIIHEVYSILHKHDPAISHIFRTLLVDAITDTDSPIWNPIGAPNGICISVPAREEGNA